MRRRRLFIEPVAIGLVLANVVVIGVVVASLFVTRRAWELREDALDALAEARARPSLSLVGVARPLAPTLHAPPGRLRSTAMERMVLVGILGAAASATFTWLVVRRALPARGRGRRTLTLTLSRKRQRG